MEDFRDYFLCDSCQNKEFRLVYNFSLRFHGVNFSDDLIYDEIAEETYQCTRCDKVFSRNQIREGLVGIKKKRKKGVPL